MFKIKSSFPTRSFLWTLTAIVLLYFFIAIIIVTSRATNTNRADKASDIIIATILLIIIVAIQISFARDFFRYLLGNRGTIKLSDSSIFFNKKEYHYKDIEKVYCSTIYVKIYFANKNKLFIPGSIWPSLDEWCIVFTHKAFPFLILKFKTLIENETADFGCIKIKPKEGILYRNNLISWNNIQRIRTQDSYGTGYSKSELFITTTNKNILKIDRSKIVNEFILIDYITQKVSQKTIK